MKGIMFLNGSVEVQSLSGEPSNEDIRILVDGPRGPFHIVNESNGMHLRFTAPLEPNERLWIEVKTRQCYRKVKAAGSQPIPCGDHLHVPPAQVGWGWMRLKKGINTLRIVPL